MKKLCLVKKKPCDIPTVHDQQPKQDLSLPNNISFSLSNVKLEITDNGSITDEYMEYMKYMEYMEDAEQNVESPNLIKKIIKKKPLPEDFLPHPVEYYSWCKDEKYIDKNGNKWVLPHSKKFPGWIFKKYEKYKLSELEDEVKEAVKDDKKTPEEVLAKTPEEILATKSFLYQEFIANYICPESPYRSILLNHGLGSGKSNTSIKVAESFRGKGFKIICLLPASLRNNYIDEIKTWGNHDLRRPSNYSTLNHQEKMAVDKQLTEKIKRCYTFVSYNSNMTHKRISELKLKNCLIIIDEVHNLINLLCSKESKYAQGIYDHLMSAENCRFVALSGSPILNGAFRVAVLCNILKGYIRDPITKKKYTLFPEKEEEFNELFIDIATNNIKNADLFKSRISGLISNYEYMQGDLYPEVIVHEPIILEMSEYQFLQYSEVRAKEKKTEANAIKFGRLNSFDAQTGEGSKSYRSQSRQYCNFTFPPGIQRPKTSSTKSRELSKSTTLNKDSRQWTSEQTTILKKHLGSGTRFNKFATQYEMVKSTKEQLLLIMGLLNEAKITSLSVRRILISDDEIEWVGNPNFYSTMIKKALDDLSENPENLRGSNLRKLSCKMAEIYKNMEEGPGHEGLKFIYSCFRSLEGVEIFSRILKAHGYELLTEYNIEKLEEIGEKKRFAIVSGEEDQDVRSSIISVMYHHNNIYGKYCMVLLGTSATAEGISLKYMRQAHIIEPWWNDVKIDQVIGRCRRLGSHLLLPVSERNVHVYRYLTKLTEEQQVMMAEKQSTDEYIYQIALNKKHLNNQFLQQLRDGAVDAMLNYNHNKRSNNINPVFYNTRAKPTKSTMQSAKSIKSGPGRLGKHDDRYIYIPDIHQQHQRRKDNRNRGLSASSSITTRLRAQKNRVAAGKAAGKAATSNVESEVEIEVEIEMPMDDPDYRYIKTVVLYAVFDPRPTAGVTAKPSEISMINKIRKLYDKKGKGLYLYKVDEDHRPIMSKMRLRGGFSVMEGIILYDRSIHTITQEFAPKLIFSRDHGFLDYSRISLC